MRGWGAVYCAEKVSASGCFQHGESVVIQAFSAPFKAQKKRLESDGFRPLFGLGFER